MQVRKGTISCSATILRVSSLLYCGSMVENSLSDAASTPKSAVEANQHDNNHDGDGYRTADAP